jgi:hypothetical protein
MSDAGFVMALLFYFFQTQMCTLPVLMTCGLAGVAHKWCGREFSRDTINFDGSGRSASAVSTGGIHVFDAGWLKNIGRNFKSAARGPVSFMRFHILGRKCALAI